MTSHREQEAHSPRLEAVIQVGDSRCPLCINAIQLYILTGFFSRNILLTVPKAKVQWLNSN